MQAAGMRRIWMTKNESQVLTRPEASLEAPNENVFPLWSDSKIVARHLKHT